MKLTIPLAPLYLTTGILSLAYDLQPRGSTCSDVRYPPPSVCPPPQDGYQGHNFASWAPPPAEHLYGIFHITHISYDPDSSPIANLANLRTERYPLYTDNEDATRSTQAEIYSWSTCAEPVISGCQDASAVSTMFGHDVPMGAQGPTDKKYAAAWEYNATGSLEGKIDSVVAILAWGVDLDNFDYFVQYQIQTQWPSDTTERQEGVISIASRNKRGIDHTTYLCLLGNLKQVADELGDTDLSATVSQVKPVHMDDRRDGQGPVECNAACLNNTNVAS